MQGEVVKVRTLWFVLRWVWITLSVLLLLLSMVLFDGSPKSDADIVLGYGLLILTVPIGGLVSILDGFIGRAAFDLLGLTATTTYTSLILTWLVYSIVGYLQWFVFLPWLFGRWRARNERPS